MLRSDVYENHSQHGLGSVPHFSGKYFHNLWKGEGEVTWLLLSEPFLFPLRKSRLAVASLTPLTASVLSAYFSVWVTPLPLPPYIAGAWELNVYIGDKSRFAWSLKRGRRVLFVWSLWLPSVLFWKHWLLQNVLKTTLTFTPELCFTKETGTKQYLKCFHVISGFNLESGAGLWKRWEGNFFLSWGFCMFFLSLRFSL